MSDIICAFARTEVLLVLLISVQNQEPTMPVNLLQTWNQLLCKGRLLQNSLRIAAE